MTEQPTHLRHRDEARKIDLNADGEAVCVAGRILEAIDTLNRTSADDIKKLTTKLRTELHSRLDDAWSRVNSALEAGGSDAP